MGRTTPSMGRPPPDLERPPPRWRTANSVRPRTSPSAAHGQCRPPRTWPSAVRASGRPVADGQQWTACSGRPAADGHLPFFFPLFPSLSFSHLPTISFTLLPSHSCAFSHFKFFCFLLLSLSLSLSHFLFFCFLLLSPISFPLPCLIYFYSAPLAFSLSSPISTPKMSGPFQ